MRKTAATLILAVLVTGCASSSHKIAASYVSPIQYQQYDCEQLTGELARVRAAALSSGAQVDKAANNDAGIMAAGMILFWPALFFLGGNQAKEAEYAKLKGEMEALDKAIVEKKCAVQPSTTSPPLQQVQAPASPVASASSVEHITITSTRSPAALATAP